jgi:MoaA/NifB/PqqE/SkfB family radical SAM enzyme
MNVPTGIALRMLARATWNLWRKNPLSVSFEITHSCTANCWHCNWGGPIKETRRTPGEYAAISRKLNPVVVNISGGEPLARGDVEDVVRAIARPGRLPWMVVVSNGSNLTPAKFQRLKAAGMHQLSLSIDFPDDRHSQFRRIPGLFDHLDRTVPACVALGQDDDILLNCCITAWNYRTLPDIVRVAARWGVPVNFSAYTPLRMDDTSGLVKNKGTAEVEQLHTAIEQVIELRRQGFPVYTAERTLWKFYRFLIEGSAPGCKAGYKFVVINPDGRMTPCAMVMAYFDDHRAMQRDFSRHNDCSACYISTRANTEKSPRELLGDNLAVLGQMLHLGRNGRSATPATAAATARPAPARPTSGTTAAG